MNALEIVVNLYIPEGQADQLSDDEYAALIKKAVTKLHEDHGLPCVAEVEVFAAVDE
jgi:hypothetical protein